MRKFLFTIAFLALPAGLFSQTLPSLLVPSDAAGLGMASATVAGKPCAFTLENNASSMSFLEKTFSIAASYGMWQPAAAKDQILGAGAVFKATGRLAFGVAAKMFNQPAYTIFDENGVASQVNGTFTPKEASVGLGVSFAVTDFLSVGVTGKMLSSSLAKDAKANVFGGDVSLVYAADALRAGLSVNNLGGKVKYGTSEYSQPSLVKAGASYTFGSAAASAVTAAAEADYLFAGALMAGMGAEYSYKDRVFARAGFHYGDKAKAIPSYASLGLGGQFAGVSLNAAFLLGSKTLGNSLLFSLGYAF